MAVIYKVMILDPAPDEAEQELNALAEMGWRVVAVAHQDRVILHKCVWPQGDHS